MRADELAVAAVSGVEAAGRGDARTKAAQFLRYFLMSAVALALDFGMLVFCVELLGWDYRWGAAAGFTVGTVFAYVVSVAWIFPNRRFEHWSAGLPRFAVVGAMGLLLNVALMVMFVDWMGLNHRWSKVWAAAASFLFNYVVRRAWLFTRSGGMDVA